MPRLWVLMSDGAADEVVAEADTIDEARAALADALRREADDDRDDGELYRITAEAVEKLWKGRLNEDLDVGYGAGLAEEPPPDFKTFQAIQRRCERGEDCDIVPTYTTWTVTDRDPDVAYQQHPDRGLPRRAPRRYENDEWGPAWEPVGVDG